MVIDVHCPKCGAPEQHPCSRSSVKYGRIALKSYHQQRRDLARRAKTERTVTISFRTSLDWPSEERQNLKVLILAMMENMQDGIVAESPPCEKELRMMEDLLMPDHLR